MALACCDRGTKPGDGRPTVVSSIFVLHDFVRRVGAEHVRSAALLTPGRSAHGYAPPPKLAAVATSAQLAFSVGLGLDGWAAQLVKGATASTPHVALGAEVEPKTFAGTGQPDPHVWMSPAKALRLVDVIVGSLSSSFPAHDAAFSANADRLRASIRALQGEIAATAKRFRHKSFVTTHGAFNYLAEDLGLNVAAVIAEHVGARASEAHLDRVVRAARSSRAAVVCTEPQLDRQQVEVLAAKLGLPVRELDPLGGVAGRDSYEQLMRYNVAQLLATMA